MTNLKRQESDQINYDGSSLGDMFRFYYTKGVECEQVDYENDIANNERFIAGKTKYISMLSETMAYQRQRFGSIDPKTAAKYEVAVDELMHAERLVSSLVEACDTCIEKRENGTETFQLAGDGQTSLGKSIIEFLELYVSKLSLDELLTIFNCVELMHQDKEISWYHYLVASISTSRRLAMATKKDAGWWDTCDRLRKNKATYQQSHNEVAMDTEARVFGEMNINMESTIDQMRFLRSAAENNSCDLFEAACLFEQ